jgi:heterodisulfide reductase subunit A
VDAVDVPAVVEYVSTLPSVVVARSHRLLCSEEGCAFIQQSIKDDQLSQVVVAACSPREHEKTFRKACAGAGLNPYQLQMANLREHVAWVIKDKDKATSLSKSLVAAATARVQRHVALAEREIAMESNVLVVGAGVAGLSAAAALAQKQRHVYLVEKQAAVGGKVVRYGELGPRLECAPCILQPLIDSVLNHDRITVFTHARIEKVVGDYGNFTVTIRKRARFVDKVACIGCDACLAPCPVNVAVTDHGLGETRTAMYHPWKGALPNVPLIDAEHCLRSLGEDCRVCEQNCPFGAIKYDDQDVLEEIRVGAVVLATGLSLFDVRNVPQYGYGLFPEVYTSFDMELMLSKNGCTQGDVRCKDGRTPQRVAILHCVGSRSPSSNDYCSNVCCQVGVKLAHLIRHQSPETQVTNLYSEMCIGDKDGQALLRKVEKDTGVSLLRLPSLAQLRIEEEGQSLQVRGPGTDQLQSFDMVVLMVGMEGAGKDSAEKFDVSVDTHGFFVEAHGKLDPAGTTTAGVMVAGASTWPSNVEGAVARAQAAAGKVLSCLIPGEMMAVDPQVAEVEPLHCSGCKQCLGLCPYHAIALQDQGDRQVAFITDTLCKGCGTCAASCPSQAIVAHHFTDGQLTAELSALLRTP